MINFVPSNKYQSPYGSVILQEKMRASNNKEDSFTSKSKNNVKKSGTIIAGTTALLASGVALFKNKGKIIPFLKNIPKFFSKNKHHFDNIVKDIPYKEL